MRLRVEAAEVLHWTRNWLHYGGVITVVLFTLIAAAEGAAGR